MEGVPRIPMLGFSKKRSADVPDFRNGIKKFISEHYNEDPEAYSTEISTLESLRAGAVHASRDFTGCATLKRYFCQLHYLKSRFPFQEGSQIATSFSWYDVHSDTVHGWKDIDFEMSCILYNIGALHSELGTKDSRLTADGMKTSCTHFQCAAWAFQHLKNDYHKFFSPDLSSDILSIMANICLAQAQECILEKSLIDNRKSAITAKVSLQIVEYYQLTFKTIESVLKKTSPSHSDKVIKAAKKWRDLVEVKIHYYGSLSYLYRGLQSEEQSKFGERITFFKGAMDKLTDATKLIKAMDKSDHSALLVETLNFTTDVIGTKLTSSEKENEFVYHEKVPTLESVDSENFKGVSLVKGIPFKFDDPEVSGPDIFARLVPMEAHEASSLYSEEKAKIMRQYSTKIEEKNEALERFLLAMQLHQLDIHSEETKIPQALVDCCAALSVNPEAVKKLSSLMSKLSGMFHDVEHNIKEISELLKAEDVKEKEFQEIVGKRPPNNLLTELSREVKKYQHAHSVASESNQTLHEAMRVHVLNLQILMKPLPEVLKHIPSVAEIEEKDEIVINEMKRLRSKIEEMQKQREMLMNQLRESILNDDITKSLVVKQDQVLETVFEEELKKHEKITQLLDQNMIAQENILRATLETNATYAATRKATEEVLKKRSKDIDALLGSYDAYNELLIKCTQGVEFYTKLDTNVSKLLQRVKSACKVQEEEREERTNVIIKATQQAKETANYASYDSTAQHTKDQYLNLYANYAAATDMSSSPNTLDNTAIQQQYEKNLALQQEYERNLNLQLEYEKNLSLQQEYAKLAKLQQQIAKESTVQYGTNYNYSASPHQTDSTSTPNYTTTAAMHGQYGIGSNSVQYYGAITTSQQQYPEDSSKSHFYPANSTQAYSSAANTSQPQNSSPAYSTNCPHPQSYSNTSTPQQQYVPTNNISTSSQQQQYGPTNKNFFTSQHQPYSNTNSSTAPSNLSSVPPQQQQQQAYCNTNSSPPVNNNQSSPQRQQYSNINLAATPSFLPSSQQLSYPNPNSPATPSNVPQSVPQQYNSSTAAPSNLPSSIPQQYNSSTAAPSNLPSSMPQQYNSSTAVPTNLPSSIPQQYNSSTAAPSNLPSSIPQQYNSSTAAPSNLPSSIPQQYNSSTAAPSNLPSSIPQQYTNSTAANSSYVPSSQQQSYQNQNQNPATPSYIPSSSQQQQFYSNLNSAAATASYLASPQQQQQYPNAISSSKTPSYIPSSASQQKPSGNTSSTTTPPYMASSLASATMNYVSNTSGIQPYSSICSTTSESVPSSANPQIYPTSTASVTSQPVTQQHQYPQTQDHSASTTQEYGESHNPLLQAYTKQYQQAQAPNPSYGEYPILQQYKNLSEAQNMQLGQSTSQYGTNLYNYDQQSQSAYDQQQYLSNTGKLNMTSQAGYSGTSAGTTWGYPGGGQDYSMNYVYNNGAMEGYTNYYGQTAVSGAYVQQQPEQSQSYPNSSSVETTHAQKMSKTTSNQSRVNEDGKKSVIPVPTSSLSNIDLLAGVDMTLDQRPLLPSLVPSTKPTDLVSVNPKKEPTSPASSLPQLNISNSKSPISVTNVNLDNHVSQKKQENTSSPLKTTSSSEMRKPIVDPLADPAALDKFAHDVENLENTVEGFYKKSLNGPTNLDLKWKELIDVQNAASIKMSISVARCYPMKNRFPDILPHDQTRVPLPCTKDDYINASFIKGIASSAIPYIATQAPLPVTFSDFWHLIWYHHVELIACLASDINLKDHIYWPLERGKDLIFDSLTISLQSKNVKPTFVERIFCVTHSELKQTRVTVHLQLTTWTGNTFPENPASLLNFVHEVHSYFLQQRSLNRPVVVHCIAGVGKTGAFIALSAAIRDIQNGKTFPDLTSIAAMASEQRKGILNDKEYLRFIHQVLLYYCQDLLMKRGILSARAAFDENPKATHTRHPSQDFMMETNKNSVATENNAAPTSGEQEPESNSLKNNSLPCTPSHRSVQDDVHYSPRPRIYSDVPASLLDIDVTTFQKLASTKDNNELKGNDYFESRKGALAKKSEEADPLNTLDPLWTLKKQ